MQGAKNFTKVELSELRKIIPKLTSERHKGQNGKLGVVGGSYDYTGAPYYAATAILRGGGDLSHIFCTEKAGTPIKSYSPELIVHSSLLDSDSVKESELNDTKKKEVVEKVTKWYESLHGFVFGPGLGRDPVLGLYIDELISKIKDQSLVCDGDMLWYISDSPSKEKVQAAIKKHAKHTTLTPNKVEFDRLWKSVMSEKKPVSDEDRSKAKEELQKADGHVLELSPDHPYVADATELSNALSNVTVFRKGEMDVISNGKKAYVVKKEGALKRSGGQGDVLSGLLGLYTYWNTQYNEKEKKGEGESTLLGCVLASYIQRSAGEEAFKKHKYGLTTPTILDCLPEVIDKFAFSDN